MQHPDFEFNEAKDLFICNRCNAEVKRGIISISSHWAECGGKDVMDNVHKIDRMPLTAAEKMGLLKQVFNVEQ